MSRKFGRTSAVSIRLHPDALQRLHAQAESLGIAAATLAALAVGEYLAGKSRDELAHRRFQVIEK